MPVIAYPDHLPTFLKASKTRRQGAAFSAEEVRRGYAYFKKTGPDVPVYWDVTFRFNRFQAIQFWLWFTLKLRRGINEFTIPIDTEGTLSTHRCRFVPDSLLPAQEYGGVWTYTATIEARALVQGSSYELVLLDTFTAADGTDPTTRDLDVYPTGMSRWSPGFTTTGVIRSNAYTIEDGADGSFIDLGSSSKVSLVGGGSFCILSHITATNDIYQVGVQMFSTVVGKLSSVTLQRYPDALYVYANADGGSSGIEDTIDSLISIPEFNGIEIKCALYIDVNYCCAIINGVIVYEATKTFNGVFSLDKILVEASAQLSAEPKPNVSLVAVYRNLQSSQAIALTA